LQCREGLTLDPENAVLVNNLGQVVLLRGRRPDAVRQFRRAASLDPRYAEPHFNIGRAAAEAGDLEVASAELRRAVLLRPDWMEAQLELAMLLSTAVDESILDPPLAVRLAERAARLAGRSDAHILDVLAMAYAASGRFDRAVDAATLALQLTPPGTDTSGLLKRLDAYRHHRRYEISR